MTKKISTLKKLCFLLLLTPNAYSKSKPEKPFENKVLNHYMYSYSNRWELNTSIGPQVYFGEHDLKYGIFNRITPAFSIGIKKQTSEYWGLRFKLNGGTECDATFIKNKPWSTKTFSAFGVGGDIMLDLNRFFSSKTYYKVPLVWSYAGVGADIVSNTTKGNDGIHPVFNMGLLCEIPVLNNLDFSMEAKGVIVPDKYDGEGGGWPVEGFLTTLFGVTYHF